MDAKDQQQLALLCRALGHPARVMIIRVLIERDVCLAGELADLVPLAASTVSQHLKILKESGLIKGEVEGPRRCYCADKVLLGRVHALLGGLLMPPVVSAEAGDDAPRVPQPAEAI